MPEVGSRNGVNRRNLLATVGATGSGAVAVKMYHITLPLATDEVGVRFDNARGAELLQPNPPRQSGL
jgi:hypothetical protein